MARPSSRPRIIDAALAVVADRGVAGLTIDAVAERAEMTKKGLLYHFATKHDLLVGVHEHLASQMERELVAAAGMQPEEASLLERTRAYVRVALQSSTNVEMRLILEAAGVPEWVDPWERVYRRWFPEDGQSVEALDDLSHRCLIARMAADGSWGYESALSAPLSSQARNRLIDGILALIEE